MTTEAQPATVRKVGIGLGIGVFLLPIVFSWFLLRKGYSTVPRVLGFVWLALGFIVMLNAPPSHTSAASSGNQAAAESTAPALAQLPKMTATALHKAYKENEVAADEHFKGKTVDIEGVVDKISKDFTDTMIVELKGGEFLASVNAYFDDIHKSTLANLKPGQRVVLRGRVDGFIMNSAVIMKDCQIIQ